MTSASLPRLISADVAPSPSGGLAGNTDCILPHPVGPELVELEVSKCSTEY